MRAFMAAASPKVAATWCVVSRSKRWAISSITARIATDEKTFTSSARAGTATDSSVEATRARRTTAGGVVMARFYVSVRDSMSRMLSRLLSWIITAAGIILIVILVTGGFRVDAGPVRLSAHRSTLPFAVFIIGALALWRLGPER